jgi:hypothetical protein
MRWISSTLAALVAAGFLLTTAPQASAGQVRRRVIVVEPFHPYYPWGWGYPYGYPPYYVASHYGEVKLDTHRKDLSVYIDGGYAADTSKEKKFTLRPGNHELEVRNSDGQTVLQEQVAVIVGKTTKIKLDKAIA